MRKFLHATTATYRLIPFLSLFLGLFVFPAGVFAQCKPFGTTEPGLGFTQELVASLPNTPWSSGYAFDSHGNVYTNSLNNGHLYKIDLSSTIPGPSGVGQIYPITDLGLFTYRTGPRIGQTTYGGNFTQYSDGTVYLNTWTGLGVVQVNLETASITSDPIPGAPAGNWGIGVDPQLNSHGHHNIWYNTGTGLIAVIDPVDHRYLGNINIYTDGLAIDPTGNFLFTTGTGSGMTVSQRDVPNSLNPDLPVFHTIGSYGGNPDGMAFGTVGTDQVVVSNDGGAATVTMWKFPNNDFTQRPTPIVIASNPGIGEYGDQANVGPDGYFYITYWWGTKFPDCSTTGNASVVRFGPAGRFLPPTHSDNISLTPATDTKAVGSSDDLTATLLTTDLSTNQTTPVDNTSVTFTVVGGPDMGQTFTGTTDANGKVTFTLVNQNGAGDDVVHAQFVDANNNTQTSNNAVITFIKPTCTAPAFSSCPGDQTANTLANSCDNTVTYTSSESVTGSPAPTVTYEFTGATTGNGTGNGSGSLFNKGTTTVTLTATNDCGTATCSFNVTVTDNQKPVITCPGDKLNLPFDFGKTYATVSVGTATATDNCAPAANISIAGLRSDAVDISNPQYPIGLTAINWTASDPSGNANNCTQNVSIRKRKTKVVFTGGPLNTSNQLSVQYSDILNLQAQLTDDEGLTTPNNISGRTITFQLLNNSGTVLRTKSALTDAGGVARDTFKIEQAPTASPSPTYSVKTIFVEDPSFSGSEDNDAVIINQEDATLTYNGVQYFTVPSTTNLTGTVTLTTSIVDDADGSDKRGDIRNARVTFKEGTSYASGTVRGTANNLVGLVTPGVLTDGLSSTTFTYTLTTSEAGGAGRIFQIYQGASNYYIGDGGPTPVVLAVPGLDNVSGGGNEVLTNSAGTYAGTTNSKMNFGFTVKYNKSGKNQQGQINVIYRRYQLYQGTMQWRTYQIKSNAITSMGVINSGGYYKAVVTTKATLSDITNPLAVISYGNHNLRLEAWDNTTDNGGTLDKLGISLISSTDNSLLFASSWSANALQIVGISGGNINAKISSTSTALPTVSPALTKAGQLDVQFATSLSLNAFPNPSKSSFTLQVLSNDKNTAINLTLADAVGRSLEQRQGLKAGQSLQIGEHYRPGVYIVEVMQGKQKATIKLIKTSD